MLADINEATVYLPPLARFAIALMLFLLVPAFCKRVRLPAVVGLIAAGVLVGPSCLSVAPRHSAVAEFFADLGKLLLMFFAGLEIELTQFYRVRRRALGFGLATFAVPLVLGLGIALLFQYNWLTGLLVGAVFASHTLIGYPIAQRLGLIRNEAVTVAIGGTIFTDVFSLLVVAICLPIHTSGFSHQAFLLQLLELAIYIPAVLIGLSNAAHYLMRRLHDSKDGQLLVMLLIVVIAAVAAEAIHLEGIIGAFLAGLAVNRAVEKSAAKHDLEFLGNALFIPAFFLTIGFMIDVRAFVDTVLHQFGLVCALVATPIVAKLLASIGAQICFAYTRSEGLMMWALSIPHVAATLAVTLTAFNAQDANGNRLFDASIRNCMLVLVVVTSILGPVLTEVYGKRLAIEKEKRSLPNGD